MALSYVAVSSSLFQDPSSLSSDISTCHVCRGIRHPVGHVIFDPRPQDRACDKLFQHTKLWLKRQQPSNSSELRAGASGEQRLSHTVHPPHFRQSSVAWLPQLCVFPTSHPLPGQQMYLSRAATWRPQGCGGATTIES